MNKQNKKKEYILTGVFIVLCAIFILPLVLVISVSVSSETDIAAYGYSLIPKHIDFAAYSYIFRTPKKIIDAYKVTFIFSIVTMVLSVLLQSMVAYALARPDFKGKKFVSFYLYFTCMFSGGLVPFYLLITQYLHLQDTIWVYIVPALINVFNIFMIRTNMQAIPNELYESAIIDGAEEYRVYWQIIMPLSKPVLATVALMTFLSKWGDWMTPMLYINNRDDLISLQYLLQKIMNDLELLKDDSMSMYTQNIAVPSETVRMAMALVVAGPGLVIFPFFQKYFTKGMTVGSVKG